MRNSTPFQEAVERAQAALKENLRGQVWQIRVVIDEEGGVALHGYASSYSARDQAFRFALETVDFASLSNRIEVRSELSSLDTESD